MQKCRRRGFTLIELLVVVGIIALLTGILIPSVSKAREAAKRTQCQAHLHSIGQAVRAYMGDHHDYYPPMASMPTVDRDTHGAAARPAMSEVLKPYVSGETRVFQCPSDRIVHPGETPPGDVSTWYEWQGSSYEPRTLLSVVGPTGQWLLSQEFRSATEKLGTSGEMQKWNELAEDLPRMVLMHDYENFHGEVGHPNNRMALFADFHVASMDEGQLGN